MKTENEISLVEVFDGTQWQATMVKSYGGEGEAVRGKMILKRNAFFRMEFSQSLV